MSTAGTEPIQLTQEERRDLIRSLAGMMLKGRMDLPRLASTFVHVPRFQRTILSRLLAAEGHENNRLFAAFEEASGDPELRAKLKRHAKDEARHARMIKELMDSMGIEPEDAGDGYLDILSRVGESNDDSDLIGFLAALVRIEEKAIRIITVLVNEFEEDHPFHKTFSLILKDEERHIAWVTEYLEQRAKTDPSVQAAISRLNAADHYATTTMQAVGPVGLVNRLEALFALAKHLPKDRARKVIGSELKNIFNEPQNGDARMREIAKRLIENRVKNLRHSAKAA